MSADSVNGWNEWSKFVLKELERLNKEYESAAAKLITTELQAVKDREQLRQDIHKQIEAVSDKLTEKIKALGITIDTGIQSVNTELTQLKINAAKWGAIWGFISGLIPVILALLGLWMGK
jgi:hypothetical protein